MNNKSVSILRNLPTSDLLLKTVIVFLLLYLFLKKHYWKSVSIYVRIMGIIVRKSVAYFRAQYIKQSLTKKSRLDMSLYAVWLTLVMNPKICRKEKTMALRLVFFCNSFSLKWVSGPAKQRFNAQGFAQPVVRMCLRKIAITFQQWVIVYSSFPFLWERVNNSIGNFENQFKLSNSPSWIWYIVQYWAHM